ncbi:MAG: hypothetical protein MZV64_30460 [Ignavibacteriales bacterium]|nr:hypothetical protein [Ignavibacteriales bacterium]
MRELRDVLRLPLGHRERWNRSGRLRIPGPHPPHARHHRSRQGRCLRTTVSRYPVLDLQPLPMVGPCVSPDGGLDLPPSLGKRQTRHTIRLSSMGFGKHGGQRHPRRTSETPRRHQRSRADRRSHRAQVGGQQFLHGAYAKYRADVACLPIPQTTPATRFAISSDLRPVRGSIWLITF